MRKKSDFKNHRIAKDFVHTNYRQMDVQAKDRINEIAFREDAKIYSGVLLRTRQRSGRDKKNGG